MVPQEERTMLSGGNSEQEKMLNNVQKTDLYRICSKFIACYHCEKQQRYTMNEHTETFDFFMPCMAGQMDTAFNKREGMEELIRMIDYITKHDPLIRILCSSGEGS